LAPCARLFPLKKETNMQTLQTSSPEFKGFYITDNSYLASAELSVMKNNLYYFNRLLVNKKIRNKGYANQLLVEVCKWADQEKINILIDINPYGDLNYDQLLRFYQKFGFKLNKNKQLIRKFI
jgi:GNAT superfamily N-acetyltransferase